MENQAVQPQQQRRACHGCDVDQRRAPQLAKHHPVQRTQARSPIPARTGTPGRLKALEDRQVVVDPRIIGYVVPRMERSPAEVAALAELMDRLALERGSAITRKIAAEALALRRQARGEDVEELDLEADDE